MAEIKQQTGSNLKSIIVLQAIIIIYTFSGVFGKLATAGNAFMSREFILYIVLDVAVLGVYALLWQQALKRFDLHVAYANRAMASVWGLIWAYFIFDERITAMNIVGTVLILAGTFLVNSDAE